MTHKFCLLLKTVNNCYFYRKKNPEFMVYKQIFFIILFLLSISANAQQDISLKRKSFKTEKPGFKVAWKHIKQGDSYYWARGIFYTNAFSEYQQAYTYNSDNAVLNYKIGVSCLYSDKKDEAAAFFIKAYELNKDVTKDILFLTGRALMYSGKFSSAIENFNNYLASPGKKPKENIILVKKYIEECNSAEIITKDTLRIEIGNLGGNINSTADDYSEVLASDGIKMLFASRRALTPKAKNYYSDTKFDENIFSSDYISGAWSVAMLFNKNLITKFCETPLFMNNAGNQLFIYAGYEGDGDIMVSELKRGKWKTPVPVSFKVNSKFPESSFTMSSTGDEIAFVSDRGRKGEGGKDIYLMKKKSKRRWSKPANIGPSVNTKYDEESVKFSSGGDTLWFSSRGHNTIGGFDVFFSARNSEGAWNKAVNAGYPINTPWDEMFYNPSPVDDSSFFFVSNRSGGFGGLDIYKGRFMPPPPPPKPVVIPEPVIEPVPVPVAPPKRDSVVIVRDTVFIVQKIQQAVIPETPKELILYLIGKVNDSETKEPVLSRIEVFDMSTDQVIATTASSDVDGSYRVRLPAKKSYMVTLRATGFLSDMKRVVIPDSYTEEFYTLDMTLVKVKVGKKVVLNNILFELGKAVLTTGSYVELDKLLQVLQDNPQMKIEISGHTDNTGNPVVNAKLSTDRARAVVIYLARKGIDIGRLTFKGYGSEQPIADNTTPDGRAKNRRVEFKVLGI
jgi:outer membrane protein OmpA-like peptidoglycan-associated protein/tetratricopeptide (TPR) repeat protein